ncbi:MAG: hypothetical protein HZB26_00525 [Candidatus Hydrogenedentes bacterium]|nr:hypothetical protein [Candidatus Hydrogenedentota bacterium]
MAQTLRLMDDVHVFDHDKASALLFAASAAYLVSRPRECVSFLTLAIQTDPQVSPRIDVFPTEVCRAYRVLRTRTK